jgi:hypothetical protein
MIYNPNDNIYEYSKFLRNALLLDTSVLMIYFLGDYDAKNDTKYLSEWKKNGVSYSDIDYQALKKFIDGIPIEKICITPHIFHEFYKHAQKITKNNLHPFFKQSIDKLLLITEENVTKDELIVHKYFDKLEIGEHSLYIVKEDDYSAILTDDERNTVPLLKDDEKLLLIKIRDAIIYTLNS